MTKTVADAKPSDFLAAGFPFCSVFGDCWYEMTAVVYLEALTARGDTWKTLTPRQVNQTMAECPDSRERGALGSILGNGKRLRQVARKLATAALARDFAPAWCAVGLDTK